MSYTLGDYMANEEIRNLREELTEKERFLNLTNEAWWNTANGVVAQKDKEIAELREAVRVLVDALDRCAVGIGSDGAVNVARTALAHPAVVAARKESK